eukprot:SAG11_NODE_707_length_7651_cov_4.133872_9_plen_219_part_00
MSLSAHGAHDRLWLDLKDPQGTPEWLHTPRDQAGNTPLPSPPRLALGVSATAVTLAPAKQTTPRVASSRREAARHKAKVGLSSHLTTPDWWSAPLSGPCWGGGFFSSSVAQWLARRSLGPAACSRAHPWKMIALGILLALLCCCGLLFKPEEPRSLLGAWLPPDTWRQADKARSERVWGSQRLDQVIITPRNGGVWAEAAGCAGECVALWHAREDPFD